MTAGRKQLKGLNDATRNQEFTIGTAPLIILLWNIGTQEINTWLPFIEQEQELLFLEPIPLQLA
jgi:hypothetical protein